MLWCIIPFFFPPTFARGVKTELRIGVVTPSGAATPAEISSLQGARLGATEAKQTAQLFGAAVAVYEAAGDGHRRGGPQAAAFLSSTRKVQIIIGISARDADTLASFAERNGLIFLDVSSRSDALRAACRTNSFHIEASDAMYANARTLGAGGQPGSVVLWDETLERFGASQLNDRYRAATGAGMDGSAWAGWAAIKIVTEAALRSQSTEPAMIRAYLEANTTRFDGHKGWPLSFRPLDHQLRQPLYMVVRSAGPAKVVDIPDLRSISSASSDRAAIDALDRLSGGRPRCAKSSR